MKKQLLFSAMMLIGITLTAATTLNFVPQNIDETNTSSYRYAEPIRFIEQGVEFLVFPNGSFDYNILKYPSNDHGRFYSKEHKNSRRISMNGNQGRPAKVNGSYFGKKKVNGLIIESDYNGFIKRIGNMNIDYDKSGRIKRLGYIKMNYDDGKLSKVGGLKVNYNRWDQIVNIRGSVNDANRNYHDANHYSTAQTRPIYKNHSNQENYYNQNNTLKKHKKVKR